MSWSLTKMTPLSMCARASASPRTSFTGGDRPKKSSPDDLRKRLEGSRAKLRKGIKTDLERIAMQEIDFASEALRAVDEAARAALEECPFFNKEE